MQRIGRIGRLQPGKAAEYIRLHREMSSELREAHVRAGIKNFSIYLHGDELFSYLEVEDWQAAYDALINDPVVQPWSALMRTLLAEPLPWPELDEVFHRD